ncbi:immune-responsive 1 [Fusarium agapanthi]|uniref:Immune-responsive 1 n=1 Tax=Fusarium agapanthi TaxID=1803897 RepID=A0A9P5B398_9HYPO|nr:immune-responsive 1 [Fusarium agapanthi]
MATRRLATWSHNLQFSDIPEDVIRAASRSFYNWVGCTIAGSRHEATKIAHQTLSPFFGPPTASLLGHHGASRLDAQHAALINGIASHVHDYDDTHLDTIIHPTGPVASALLAVAEWRGDISGKQFITALVAGIEAECKAGLAVWPEHYDVGWHITSTVGSIGAAVAASKVLGPSPTKTTHAIGLAATQVTGLREMFGSHCKSFHVGSAAQNGLLAAVMAEGGYTSSGGALEAKRGWATVVGTKKPDVLQALDCWLGTDNEDGLAGGDKGRWEILRNSFKPFPCGIVIHPAIDACVQLHALLIREGHSPSQIESVTVQVHPLVLELTGKKTPKDGLEAKFSVYHSGACGLLLGRATPSEYQDNVVLDPAVIAIRDRITANIDTSIAADSAKVSVALQSGEVFTKYVEHAIGSRENPLSDEKLQEKFIDGFASCIAVASATKHATSRCRPISGDILFRNQFQLYPSFFRWDDQRCVLYLSSIYNASIAVWDPYSSSIQRVVSIPGISHSGLEPSSSRLSGAVIDPTNNVLAAVVEADSFFLTAGNDVSGDNFVVKLDLNTFATTKINLTATTKGQYGAFIDIDNGLSGDLYVNGGYPSSILHIDCEDKVSPFYVREPTTPPRSFGFGGVARIGDTLIASDNTNHQLVKFTIHSGHRSPVVIPQTNYHNFSGAGTVSLPHRYGGKVLLMAEDVAARNTTGVSVFSSQDSWKSAKFLGFIESVDRKLEPASVAMSLASAHELGDRIYSSIVFYDNKVNPTMAGNRTDFSLRDITESVDALLKENGLNV